MLDPPLGLESVFFPNSAVLAWPHSEKPFGGPLPSMPRLRPGLFSSDFFNPDHEVSSALKCIDKAVHLKTEKAYSLAFAFSKASGIVPAHHSRLWKFLLH